MSKSLEGLRVELADLERRISEQRADKALMKRIADADAARTFAKLAHEDAQRALGMAIVAAFESAGVRVSDRSADEHPRDAASAILNQRLTKRLGLPAVHGWWPHLNGRYSNIAQSIVEHTVEQILARDKAFEMASEECEASFGQTRRVQIAYESAGRPLWTLEGEARWVKGAIERKEQEAAARVGASKEHEPALKEARRRLLRHESGDAVIDLLAKAEVAR